MCPPVPPPEIRMRMPRPIFVVRRRRRAPAPPCCGHSSMGGQAHGDAVLLAEWWLQAPAGRGRPRPPLRWDVQSWRMARVGEAGLAPTAPPDRDGRLAVETAAAPQRLPARTGREHAASGDVGEHLLTEGADAVEVGRVHPLYHHLLGTGRGQGADALDDEILRP